MESKYVTSAMRSSQLPTYELPEIAFVGRSNAGKSTLLNSLLGRKRLARTGRTPGQTKMINFFNLNDQFILADLPGFGFHEVDLGNARLWDELVSAYLMRQNIKEIIFLMDIRRSMPEEDFLFLQQLASQLNVTIAMTKSDKLSRQEGERALLSFKKLLAANKVKVLDVVAISTLHKIGVETLRNRLFNLN